MKLSAIHDSFQPFSATSMREFETAIKAELPAEYKLFLSAKNGGFIHHDYRCAGVSLRSLYGLNAPLEAFDLRGNREILEEAIPETHLSIGDDDFGNQLCMCLRGKNAGCVFLWDHEEMSFKAALSKPLAHSFDALIEQLSLQADDSYLDFTGMEARVVDGFKAIADDDAQSLVRHLGAGLDASSTDSDSVSLLHFAARECRLECVESLVNNGAEVDAVSDDGSTPLTMAIQQGCSQCIRLLVDLGASPDRSTADGLRPLQEAIEGRSVLEAATLIDCGADVSLPFSDGRSAVDWVVELYDSELDEEELRLLLAKLE